MNFILLHIEINVNIEAEIKTFCSVFKDCLIIIVDFSIMIEMEYKLKPVSFLLSFTASTQSTGYTRHRDFDRGSIKHLSALLFILC